MKITEFSRTHGSQKQHQAVTKIFKAIEKASARLEPKGRPTRTKASQATKIQLAPNRRRNLGTDYRNNRRHNVGGKGSSVPTRTQRQRPPSAPRALTYAVPNSPRGVTAKRWRTLAEFHKAVALARRSNGEHSLFHEVESMRNGVRHIDVSGREYLGPLTVSIDGGGQTDVRVGSHLAIYPMSPNALGGRLRLFSDQYEQHKLVSATISFASVLPATAQGAIAIGFVQDAGEQFFSVGRHEIEFLATHPSFTQTKVWEDASLPINPSDALKRYWDSSSGSFQDSVQGQVIVLAASEFTRGASAFTLGNLYIDYHYQFFEAQLELRTRDVSEFTLTLQTGEGIVDEMAVRGDIIMAYQSGGPVSLGPGMEALVWSAGAEAPAQFLSTPQAFIGVGVFTFDIALGLPNWQAEAFGYMSSTGSVYHTWQDGAVFYFRWIQISNPAGDESVMVVFGDLDSASGELSLDSSELSTAGALRWHATTGYTGSYDGVLLNNIRMRVWQIQDRTAY